MSLTDLIRWPSDDNGSSHFGGLFEFDSDDPDFESSTSMASYASHPTRGVNQRCAPSFSFNMSGLRKVQTSPMTLTSLQPIHVDSYDHSDRSGSVGSSNETDTNCGPACENVLSIEDLRLHLNSCFSCGVSWQDEHVSLDCSECGGYSLTRPCPTCDGKCGQLWKRDLTSSHSQAKASWIGVCGVASSSQHLSETDLLSKRMHMLRTVS